MAALTKEKRDALPDSDFAVPETRDLPLHDEQHIRMAWPMLSTTKRLSEGQRIEGRRRIIAAAKVHEMSTAKWESILRAELEEDEEGEELSGVISLQAMSLEVPETPNHPNKLPFSGVLTRLDQPSDRAPEGSGGKRVLLTRKAAQKALPSLLGMPVDITANLSGHNVKFKVGVITKADIEGDAILISGFLYEADFPDEVKLIRSQKNKLGFSWEMLNIFVKDAKADPLEITDFVFTGAAILRKDKAAYQSTSLAASAAEEISMDKAEEILAGIKTLGDRIEKIEASEQERIKSVKAGEEHRSKVESHAKALEACGDAMAASGIGGHATRGHVRACHAMADHLRAAAAMGQLAHEWPGMSGFHAGAANAAPEQDAATKAAIEKQAADMKLLTDTISGLKTTITDMKAAAASNTPAPERKTLTPQITALLARSGVQLPTEGNKLSVGDLDAALAKTNMTSVQRMEAKGALERAGLLELKRAA